MQAFQQWLHVELQGAVDALSAICPESRKGLTVALHRKRARDIETSLQLLAEFQRSQRDVTV